MKPITMMLSLFYLLLVSSLGYATVPVSVNSQGVTFPDNTLQISAAILPVCKPGEVYVKVNTGVLCAKIKPITNGIATCIGTACTVSSCFDGIGNCDNQAPNVCGTDLLNIADHCGACGVVCSTNNECQNPSCSNGVCGTTNKTPGTICTAGICNFFGDCVQAACGDGIVSAGEQCDDGNGINGDGCSAVCHAEPGYYCSGNPSVCTAFCGDGIKAGTEQCDDGNKINGDGCSSTCTIEASPSCSDMIKNGTETDVDCGGICPLCTSGKLCAINADCTSGLCSSGFCQ